MAPGLNHAPAASNAEAYVGRWWQVLRALLVIGALIVLAWAASGRLGPPIGV